MDEELIQEFLVESREGLDQLDEDFLALEDDPSNSETIGSIFRTIHSIKGTSGFLGFNCLEHVAHAGENLLSRLRDGELSLSGEMVDTLLKSADVLRDILDKIEKTGNDGSDEYPVLTSQLEKLTKGEALGESAKESDSVTPAKPTAADTSSETQAEPEGSQQDQSTESTDSPAEDDVFSESDPELISEFLIESTEGLDQMDQYFIELEDTPDDPEIVKSIFRIIHSIKGTSGFLAFGRLEKVTHTGENLLQKARDGELVLNGNMIDALLKMVDAVREMMGEIEHTGRDGQNDYKDLIGWLERLSKEDGAAQPEPTAKPIPELPEEYKAPPASEQEEAVEEPTSEAPPASPPKTPKPKPNAADSGDTGAASKSKGVSVAESKVRVDVSLLDVLMNLVGELVLTRNQILQYSSEIENSDVHNATQSLNLITSQLQESVMQTRMSPIGQTWKKYPRMIRDLANACGKKVILEMAGQDTELDRTLLEAIKDPMTHLLRNSVDHGIESPEKRVENGKPAEGHLRLRAYHEGGQVNIDIEDNGGGIDAAKVAAKAISRGILTEEQADQMSEQDLVYLIFQPGFSTAEKVTNVSGRGVGMDVVRTNVEKIGGTIEVNSKLGEGTTIKIKIPLTLAIVPAIIIESESEQIAIPQVNLVEVVSIPTDDGKSGIEIIHSVPVYRLRGNLLPLVYLKRELQDEDERSADINDYTPNNDKPINIIVLQASHRQFGLVVDEVQDTQEIVVKSLGNQLKNIPIFAGATILGDGTVALILDVLGLAQRAGVLSDEQSRSLTEIEQELAEEEGNKVQLLVIETPGEGRMILPLETVNRLEEFNSGQIEHAGHQDVIQYRDRILPLVYLSDELPERRNVERSVHLQADGTRALPTVVFKKKDKMLGIVVDNILDIVESSLNLQGTGSRDGVIGTTVLRGKVTEVLDLEWVAAKCAMMDN